MCAVWDTALQASIYLSPMAACTSRLKDPVLSACLHLFCKAICMCWKHMCAVWVWQSCSLQAFAGAFTKTPGDKCLTARRA